jgi:hypothetical protein
MYIAGIERRRGIPVSGSYSIARTRAAVIRSIAAMALCATLLFAGPARATILYLDNFSGLGDGTDNPSYSDQNGNFLSAAIASGTLTISKTATTEGQSGHFWVIPRYVATGDFQQDVTVDFRDASNAGTGSIGVNGGISVNFGMGAADSSQVSMMIDPDGMTASGYELFADGAQSSSGWMVGLQHPEAVTFRLTRIGDTVSQYYSDGGGAFILLSSVSNANFAAPSTFYLSLYAAPQASAPGSVTFSNFSVSDVPEPGIWLTMVAGFGIVGGALRSERKRQPATI